MKVKEVKNIGKGYEGMNPLAAKELGVKCPRNTILVKKSLSPKSKKKTITHEKIEYKQMKRGLKYRPAHRIATGLTRRKKRRR